MPATPARLLLHTVHALAFVVLLATGTLLLAPGLRAAITGGHALTLGAVHRWTGLASALLPLAIIAAAGPRRILAPPAVPTWRSRIQGAHILLTTALGAAFAITGAAVWGRDHLPNALVDRAQDVHDALTYAAAVLLAIHLADRAFAAALARPGRVTPCNV